MSATGAQLQGYPSEGFTRMARSPGPLPASPHSRSTFYPQQYRILRDVITATSFPTPDLALRTNDHADEHRVRSFAREQAAAAEALRRRLAGELPSCRSLRERTAVLRDAHAELVRWRYELALRAPGRLGALGLPFDAERFRTSLRAGGPNVDKLGYLGRLRAGASWDRGTQTYQGGAATAASRIMLSYGERARARFAEQWLPDADVLLNVVAVGRRLIVGNRLVRGAAAVRIAEALVARVAARGRDTSQMEIGGDPVYAVTADPDDADVLFGIAMIMLAGAVDEPEQAVRVRAWQDARYLLYQAPRTKKGSDAVTRVFVVAVGAILAGRAPVLDQDVDLRCMVLGQQAATVMPADAALLTPSGGCPAAGMVIHTRTYERVLPG
uniref:hypothetical protein n=1 Tax=Amycolatopsis sp. CA-290885 TaxID=3239925 RepID=UPI003F49A3D4